MDSLCRFVLTETRIESRGEIEANCFELITPTTLTYTKDIEVFYIYKNGGEISGHKA